MMLQISYFVHGTTTDNENEISSGWSDVDLSPLGVQQSIDLRASVDGSVFAVVVSSDLIRAVRSSQLAFEGSAPLRADTRLRECSYGRFNGHPSAIVEPMQEKFTTSPFPEGESYEDVRKRMASLLADLKREFDGCHIALVGHKAPQIALDVLLKGFTWEEAFAQDWRKRKAWQPGWPYSLA